jgi:AcrR family transcriptional regulator
VEEALDSAMDVFWRKGYEGASLTDLTAAMNIAAPSLYACFGSKEGLFRAVLERYDQRREGFLSEVLDAPTARDVATLFLKGLVERATDPKTPGCLLVQSGQAADDTTIPDMVARHRAEKEAAVRERFETAKRQGDLPGSSDPAALARYLMTIANGICVQAAAGASAKELNDVADIALMSFPASAKPKKKTASEHVAAS